MKNIFLMTIAVLVVACVICVAFPTTTTTDLTNGRISALFGDYGNPIDGTNAFYVLPHPMVDQVAGRI